jgi:hypothetical protein
VSPDLSAKLLQVFKEAVPNVVRIAVLWNAANPVKALDFDRTQRATQTLGLTIQSIEVRSPLRMEAAFAAISGARPPSVPLSLWALLGRSSVAETGEFHVPGIIAALVVREAS